MDGYLGDYDPEFNQATCHPLFYQDLQGRIGPRHSMFPSLTSLFTDLTFSSKRFLLQLRLPTPEFKLRKSPYLLKENRVSPQSFCLSLAGTYWCAVFETVYLSVGELGAMRELLGGAGLDEDDLILLFGRCPACDLLFLRKHLDEHQQLCYIGL